MTAVRAWEECRWGDSVRLDHQRRLSMWGVGLFWLGGVLDMAWHEILGVEVWNEALLSPTHLLLLAGALMFRCEPLRRGLAGDREQSGRDLAVSMASFALATSVVVFFASPLSPFGEITAVSYPTTRTHTHAFGTPNAEAFVQLRETWGSQGSSCSAQSSRSPVNSCAGWHGCVSGVWRRW